MLRLRLVSLISLIIGILLTSPLAFAQKIGADPAACRGGSSVCTQHLQTYSFVSLTEGNVAETYSAARVTSAFGPTLMFNLIYNSYNADGTRASMDTGLGFGWTHTYNDFLFTQGNDMFRMGPDGRVTKFALVNGSYQAAPGYFETLVPNGDGSFTITTKHQTKFRYQTVSDARFRTTHFGISGTIFKLISITDRNNNVTTLTYTGGNLTTITDTFGRSLTLTYNPNNHLGSVTDPLGRVTAFTYDGTGAQLVTITDPLTKTTNYTYNGLHQITSKTDRDGRTFTIAYQNNLPYSEVDANGATVYALSNPSNWATDPNQLDQNYLRVYIPSTTSRTDGRSNVWKYNYDSNGFPLTVTAPDGATTTFTYDPNTLAVASKTDANGDTTSYQYDSEGNLTQMTDANGNVTKYTYEPVFNQMTSMTDPNGRLTAYTYDSHGNRISETDPLGQTAQWTYDSNGNVLTATDKRENTTTYVYDANGNRITATDALSEVTQYTYDGVGNRSSTTDPNGHITTDQYDALNRLTLETDALGGTKKTSYDGESDKIKVVDHDGNATSYSYDLRRRMTSTTDALGKPTTYAYDGNDNRVSMTDRNGHMTAYSYDVQNRLISTTDALGDVSSKTYDGVGNKLTETDADSHTTTYLYDHLNRKTQKSDALNEVTMWGYDLTGLPGCPECTGPTLGSNKVTKQTDCNGKVIYWAYDGLDRLGVEIHKQGTTDYLITPDDAVTRYAYDPTSNRTSMTDPVGNTTTYSYDAVNRQDQVVNAEGDTWITSYDNKGNIKTVTTPNRNVTTNTYDALDRLIQVDDEVGRVANYTYDPASNRLTSKDGNGNGTTNTYDVDYRVTAVTDALGQATHYTFDAVGNMLTTTDRQGSVTTDTYDKINRRISTTLALGNTIKYAYDPVGNQTSITDPNGNATIYTYDPVNRLIAETYADGTRITYGYDCTGHLLNRTDQNLRITKYRYSDLYYLLQREYQLDDDDNFTYDLAGKMLTAKKGDWLDTFLWDERNFLTEATQDGMPISYEYFISQRVNTVGYPSGDLLLKYSDARGRMITYSQADEQVAYATYGYDPGGRITQRTTGNRFAFETAYPTFNANNWVTALDNTGIANFNYSYDNEGTKLFEQKLPDSSPARSEVYGYNSIYQLTDFKAVTLANQTPPPPNIPAHRTHFTLDLAGNWSSKTTDGVQQTRTHNSLNEITTINGAPLAYDLNGNLLEDPQYRYTYSQNNQLTGVTDKSLHPTVLEEIKYDALGRRIEKIGIPATTRYFYDGAQIIEEQDVVGVPKAIYFYGNGIDEIVGKKMFPEEPITYFYQQNALGSVVAVTDSSFQVLERYTYDAYGDPTVTDGNGVPVPRNQSGTPHSAIGNNWMFTGRYLDEETGLFDYRSRYLHTGLGRFLQRDSIGNWGDSGNLGNGYAYVGNNPPNYADPLGNLSFGVTYKCQVAWVKVGQGSEHCPGEVCADSLGFGWDCPCVYDCSFSWTFSFFFTVLPSPNPSKPLGESGGFGGGTFGGGGAGGTRLADWMPTSISTRTGTPFNQSKGFGGFGGGTFGGGGAGGTWLTESFGGLGADAFSPAPFNPRPFNPGSCSPDQLNPVSFDPWPSAMPAPVDWRQGDPCPNVCHNGQCCKACPGAITSGSGQPCNSL